jgi:hypothetical protein
MKKPCHLCGCDLRNSVYKNLAIETEAEEPVAMVNMCRPCFEEWFYIR